MRNACETREHGRAVPLQGGLPRLVWRRRNRWPGVVGLYPYNDNALRRALEHVGSDATPRTVVEQCVSINLLEADRHIADGNYPHKRARERFDFKVTLPKEALLNGLHRLRPTGLPCCRRLGRRAAAQDRNFRRVRSDERRHRRDRDRRPAGQDEPNKPANSGAEKALDLSPLLPLLQWQNGKPLLKTRSTCTA